MHQLWSTELPPQTTSGSSHSVYDASKSNSFQKTGATWQISYGDGSTASGDVGTDDVTIGGLTIKGQAIELAKQLSAQFASGPGDGLLGLAFGKINTVTPGPVKTPVENMIAQADIPKESELFTAHLSNIKNPSDAAFYTFGYIDQTALEGQTPYYTPIDSSQGFWMFDSASAVVAGKNIPRSGNTAIADTGTTLALVDDAVCKAIYDAIPGGKYDSSQQGYVFPSNTDTATLPDVSFAVGGKQFSVHKQDLAFADAGNGMVYGGVQSRGTMTFDILGDTWLKGVYAVSFEDSFFPSLLLALVGRLGWGGWIGWDGIGSWTLLLMHILANRFSIRVTRDLALCRGRRRRRRAGWSWRGVDRVRTWGHGR